jgi:hypothetical protein
MRRSPIVLRGHFVMKSDAPTVPSFDGTTRHRGPTSACIFAASVLIDTVIPVQGAVESVAHTTGARPLWAVAVERATIEIASA